jgi:hypothetical protein
MQGYPGLEGIAEYDSMKRRVSVPRMENATGGRRLNITCAYNVAVDGAT